ncbi:MAG: 1-acyl-sn-glycerol-3-phosphate acyltransferase [Nitrospirae bacterium]|nr:1-acyl-sn-glycerol-3-phosphate acyltransferase [Candidatus Manganitrophaceae bacterium]
MESTRAMVSADLEREPGFWAGVFYRIAHIVVWMLARLFFRLQVIGVSEIPREGGVIVAANHNSYFDIPLLGCALFRRADNIAKAELFQNRLVGALFRMFGGFPVRRGTIDRQALAEAVGRLRAGHLLAMYPEGTRSKDGRLQPPKPGIGMIVAQSGAKVVPAFIRGTDPVRPFKPVTVVFGKPIDFKAEIELFQAAEKEGMNPKKLYATISQEIMTQIAALEKELSERNC